MTCLPPIYPTMGLSPVASDIDRWSVASRVSPGTVSVTMVNGSPRSALTASWTVAKLSRTYYAHAATDSPGLDRANRGYLLSMLLERLPEVQSLAPEDKWRLIDELWSDLARQVEGAGPEDNIVELLEKRFSDYLLDPSQGQRADEVFARLAEHKRQSSISNY